MRLKQMLTAFGFGAVASVIAHTLIVDLDAQSGEDDKLVVCVNTEGTMRKIDPDASCRAGEQKLPLKLPKVQLPCEKEREADIAKLQNRIAELEGRGDERILDRTAMAPFEVVNEAGIVVFSVKAPPSGDYVVATDIFNETGERVAHFAANDEGGGFGVESGVSNMSAGIIAFGNYADFSVRGATGKKLEMGRRENGRYGLRIFGAPDKMVAGIGESEGGSGIAVVADAAGNPRVAINLLTESGAGLARIIDASGNAVATLSATGQGGSGLLQLLNNADTVMVEAGVLDTGIGVVRAGPGAFQHGIMFAGLPASYIEGKK
jgi:hypothetical protein